MAAETPDSLTQDLDALHTILARLDAEAARRAFRYLSNIRQGIDARDALLALGERQETAEPPQIERPHWQQFLKHVAGCLTCQIKTDRLCVMGTTLIEQVEPFVPALAAHREGPATADPPPCAKCGGPHPFDTSIPSPTWNAVIRAAELPDYLCLPCIVKAFIAAGQSFTATLFSDTMNGDEIEVTVNSALCQDVERLSEENNRFRLAERERSTLDGLTRHYVSSDGSLVTVDAHIARDRTGAVYLAADVDAVIAALKAGHLRQYRTYQDEISRLSAKDCDPAKPTSSDAETPSAHREGRPPAAEKCSGCEQGLPVLMLDDDGVRIDISGKPGKPSHAVEDSWWLCTVAASRAELIEENKRLRDLIPTCAECGEVILDNSDIRCSECLAGHAPASETPRPAETCECGRALPTMCGGCIVEDYEAAFGHVVSPASETGQASAWQPIAADGSADNVIASRIGRAWQETYDVVAGDTIDRGLALLRKLKEAGFSVAPLPLAPSEDETTKMER